MRLLRAAIAVALLAVAALAGYWIVSTRSRNAAPASVTVYYCKSDGQTLVPWRVSLGPARDRKSVAFYAATQTLAGPPAGVDAIRFPPGTLARSVALNGSSVIIDLNRNVESAEGGSLTEAGEFKALVWTLTALPGISAVQIEIEGKRVPTIPGGHLELDEPLARQSW
jgi:spore germination protein GerM